MYLNFVTSEANKHTAESKTFVTKQDHIIMDLLRWATREDFNILSLLVFSKPFTIWEYG